jgi:phosphoserine phosphatase RsbU/P
VNFIIFTRLKLITFQGKLKNPELKQILRFQGLAFRYGFYILAGILIIFIIAFSYTFTFSYRILLSDARQNAANVTQLTIARIRNVLQPVEDVPELLAKKLEFSDTDPKAVLKSIQEFISNNKEVYGSTVAFEPYQCDPKEYYFAPYYFERGDSVNMKMLKGTGYDYFHQVWYKSARTLGKGIWSEPYFDKGGGDMFMCTYSVPFYKNINGEKTFAGVVTMDISLTSLRKIVDTIHVYQTGYGFLISRSGKIITHKDSTWINRDILDLAKGSKDTNLINAYKGMMKGESDFVRLRSIFEKKPEWMSYSPVIGTKWSFGLVFPVKEIFSSFFAFFWRLIIIFIASVTALLILIIMITRKFTRPITRLVEATHRIGQGDFNAPLPVYKAKDEIMQLSNSFSLMQEELHEYINHLRVTTAINEKMQGELNVARTIQMGLLPKSFPNREDVEVSTFLEPAKTIGGDLYDFILTDDHHLWLAIGDVSGKGVPAALFMAIARTLFRSMIGKGEQIKTMMEIINGELCRENPSQMFVTFIAARIDLKTGLMELCNAGHTQPLIIRNGNNPERITHLGGLPLGIFDHIEYSSCNVSLQRDDLILFYTDGITEAFNIDEDLYGEDRLIKLTGTRIYSSASDLSRWLMDDVRNFSGGAEQSDDITILVMKYKGKAMASEKGSMPSQETVKMLFVNSIDELPELVTRVEALMERWSIPAKIINDIHLSIEELVSNINFYAFDDGVEHQIVIEFSRTYEGIVILIEDEGKPFDPVNDTAEVDLTLPAEERQVGGLGVHLVKTLMDKVDYRRTGNKNIVTLIKNI